MVDSQHTVDSDLDMKTPIRVIAQIVAKTGKEDQVKTVLVSLAKPTRHERGCLQYELLQNCCNPSEFVLIEEWETQANLDSHITATHTKVAKKVVESWLETASSRIQTYQTII